MRPAQFGMTLMFFAKLHPLLVQFPVALLVSGAVFELYGKLQREEAAVVAAEFNLRLGFWCALPTAVVGALGALGLEDTQKFRAVLSWHAVFACATVAFFAAAFLARRFWKNRGGIVLYAVLATAGFASVLAAGYFGGELVHRFGVAALRPLQ